MSLSYVGACGAIAEYRSDALVVVTMGTMVVWPQVASEDLYVSSVPMMGGASCLGLGLAIAQPERPVFVLDGDGSLLMQLGSLVTIAKHQPRNFLHFVFDNGVWYSNGGYVPHPGAAKTDFVGLALAAGYRSAHRADSREELSQGLAQWVTEPGPTLIQVSVDRLTDAGLPAEFGPDSPQPFMPDDQFTRMGDEGRRMRRALTDGNL